MVMEQKRGLVFSSHMRMLGGMRLSGTQPSPVSSFCWGNPPQALITAGLRWQTSGSCESPDGAGCPHPGPPVLPHVSALAVPLRGWAPCERVLRGAQNHVRGFQHIHVTVPGLSAEALPARDSHWGCKWGCSFFFPQVCSPGQKNLTPFSQNNEVTGGGGAHSSLKWKKGKRDSVNPWVEEPATAQPSLARQGWVLLIWIVNVWFYCYISSTSHLVLPAFAVRRLLQDIVSRAVSGSGGEDLQIPEQPCVMFPSGVTGAFACWTKGLWLNCQPDQPHGHSTLRHPLSQGPWAAGWAGMSSGSCGGEQHFLLRDDWEKLAFSLNCSPMGAHGPYREIGSVCWRKAGKRAEMWSHWEKLILICWRAENRWLS